MFQNQREKIILGEFNSPRLQKKGHRNSDRITVAFFYEKLWLTIIDMATVHADGRMTFKFQGGTEIDA